MQQTAIYYINFDLQKIIVEFLKDYFGYEGEIRQLDGGHIIRYNMNERELQLNYVTNHYISLDICELNEKLLLIIDLIDIIVSKEDGREVHEPRINNVDELKKVLDNYFS